MLTGFRPEFPLPDQDVAQQTTHLIVSPLRGEEYPATPQGKTHADTLIQLRRKRHQ